MKSSLEHAANGARCRVTSYVKDKKTYYMAHEVLHNGAVVVSESQYNLEALLTSFAMMRWYSNISLVALAGIRGFQIKCMDNGMKKIQ